MYCVDLSTQITQGNTYDATTTNDGTVTSLVTSTNTTGLVNNAGQIAWLVKNEHPADVDHALALQASIWKAEYGASFDLVNGDSTSAAVYADYLVYNTALGSNTSPVGQRREGF